MAINRAAALKKAEKLLRQGKLDGAIEEYVRLIADQPRDWNAINALGDLYVRAGDGERAVAQFTRVADHLFGEGFLSKAAALYKKALKVQPQHEHTLSQLAEIAARQGLLVDAKSYLRQLEQVRRQRGDEHPAAPAPRAPAAEPASQVPTLESAGDDPALLFAVAQRELASGDEPRARAILMRVLTVDPARHADVTQIALDFARGGRVESAFGCIDLVADAALLDGDWRRAAEALESFVGVVPHIPALIKLVEICVDGGLEELMRSAQAQLADAYLEAGRGAEARVISEDLLEGDPGSDAHAERLRRALELLGIADRGQIIAELRDRQDAAAFEVIAEAAATEAAGPQQVEFDLSEALTRIGAPPPPDTTLADDGDPYDRAAAHLQAGNVSEAISALEAAVRLPRTRVKAATELGRLLIRRGDLQRGIEWLERAADGPTATPEEGFAVLYELADALERLGQPARALAILIDLDADSGGYRDVRARIEQLARAQAGSGGR